MSPSPAPAPIDQPALEGALLRWLPARRWFAGKARDLATVTVADEAAASDDVRLVVAEASYAEGPAERYLVPLVDRGPGTAVEAVLVEGDRRWCDALDDPEATRLVLRLATEGARIATERGGLVLGTSISATDVEGPVHRLGVEQSNSSAVLDDRVIVKVLRRLDEGENPEVELTGALTAAGSPDVPALRGSLRWRLGPSEAVLAVVHDFVAGGREGWALATAEAAALGAGEAPALGAGEAPVGSGARALGEAVGAVHVALARELGLRRGDRADAARWTAAADVLLEGVLATAARRDPEGTHPVRERRGTIEGLLARAAALDDVGAVIRVHGDLHLGQVLLDADGRWRILDFEGEPARDLASRRAPASPLRDVAGMLRSFDYAVGQAVAAGASEDALSAWRDALRDDFLSGWLARAAPEGLVPDDPEATATLLAVFELEKAVYELGYELANRPDWVPIPVGGLLRILARGTTAPASLRGGTPPPAPSTTTAATATAAAAAPTTDAEEPPVVRPHAETSPPTPTEGAASGTDEVGATVRGGIDAVVAGTHADPHQVLGLHERGDGPLVRAYRPEADAVEVRHRDGTSVVAERVHDGGVFEAALPRAWSPGDYRLHVTYGEDAFDIADAYAFWPTIGEIDLHLAGEGRHEELWRRLGAHLTENEGVTGTSFAVWAPNARSVRVVGDFNSWDGRLNPMRKLPGGIWELFVPDVRSGALYQYELLTATGETVKKADPFAFATEVPPGRASKVFGSEHVWSDEQWRAAAAERDPLHQPMSVYEVHLGSWRHRDGRSLTYRELADDLVGHVAYCGFTHVEMLPPAEHPFGGSWGYQVTGYYAPTARFGDPDDFRYLVDRLHQAGIGVIVDWVPAHFPKDDWALARFDGTALYEHADPRQGEHPDWGTLVFNFGRNEVRNFLIANALYWLEELHVDGLRVDAVASMLYLDYSREEGQWVPNAFGGRENLEAVDFLKELNAVVYGRNPDAMVIAEESTAWPGVSRPVHLGGLGFGFKWNMGWMHDSLDYVQREPIHRRYHHHQLTFALMYAFSENFVLPFSHDEVVHGKRSMLDKMPGDRWQKFANLRALYGYMWAHPGKQLIFMGSEFGQWREWSEERELDWWLTDEPDHAGLQGLVGALNAAYRQTPALWEQDDVPEGFQWIDANDADDNVFSFLRWSRDGSPLACVTNFSAVVRRQRVGLPAAGRWDEVLNTDAEPWGGSNVGNYGGVDAEETGWHGLEASAEVTLPPLATVWLRPAA